jgi:DNA-binding NarL/FixJ family response regulator
LNSDPLAHLDSTDDGESFSRERPQPGSAAENGTESSKTESKSAPIRERKVLLVEPDEKDRQLMRSAILMQSPIFDVFAVTSAEEALNLARSTAFDVVVAANELNGYPFEDLLKGLNVCLPFSPVIVVTRQDSPDLALKLLLSGASDYLPKFGEFQRFLPRTITTNLQRAIIIENLKEMYEKVEQSSRDEALLNRFVVNIHGSLDIQDILDRATESLLEEFNAARAIICLIKEPDNEMRIARQRTRNEMLPVSDRSPIFSRYHDMLLDVGERRPLVVMQDDTFPFATDVRGEMLNYRIKSMVMLPLVYRGRLTGLLHLDEDRDSRLWNARDINILNRMANQLSIGLYQAKLYQLVNAQSSSIDKLTELCAQLNKVVDSTKELTERTESREKVRIKLSSREIEVLKKVAQGLSNKEIAEELHITEGTTEVHVSRLRKKLNLSTRAALVRYAYENHLS